MNKKIDLPIIWDDKYERMGVSPYELYLRQQGLCYLISEVGSNGEVKIYCTDGEERAPTAGLLNPTFECAKCMAGFTAKVVKDAIKSKENKQA